MSLEFSTSQANYGFFSESGWEFQPTWEGALVGGVAALLAYKAGVAYGLGYGAYRLGQGFLQPAGGP